MGHEAEDHVNEITCKFDKGGPSSAQIRSAFVQIHEKDADG